MNKKIYVSFAILLSIMFSITFCFATSNTDGLGNTVNDVRNFVGGVENTVENAALDITDTSKNITGDMENGMNSDAKTNGTMGITTKENSSSQYSTARTSTDNTVMGMTSTAWTWIILAIVAIAIIALVWYYSMQITNSNMYNHRNDE